MRCVLVVVVGFVLSLAAAEPRVEYDPARRAWKLSNGLIEAEYRLNDSNFFRLVSLRRPGGRAWVTNSRPLSSPVYLKIDDLEIDELTPWELVDTRAEAAERGGQRQIIQIRSLKTERRSGTYDPKAEITLRLEIHPDQPFIRSSYSYRNLDTRWHYVDEARFFNLRLDTQRLPMRAFFVGQFRPMSSMMFDVFERDLAYEPNRAVTLWSGAAADHSAWLALRDSNDSGLIFGWEFNGRATLRAQANRSADRVDIEGTPQSMHVAVLPGRELNLPGGFLGQFEGDWDEAGYRTHRYVESVLALPIPDLDFPYLMFNTWGYDRHINETTLRRAAQIAAQIGVEVFVVDLGWSQQIGDWNEDAGKFPGGLQGLAQYVRGLGMKFGLHFVPVEAHADSPILQANPDWTASENNYYFESESLCIAHAPVQLWMRNTFRNIVERYRPDWITQDAENLVKECSKTSHTHNPANSNWANSVNGIDSFIKAMRASAPGTYWENNADGGTMSTYEAVKHYVTFSSCDACPHQQRRQAIWGMSYAFPARFMDRYMGDAPTKFVTRSSMFGGPWILMNRITEWTPADIQLVRQEAALYKSLRGLIREGKVHHLLGPPNGYSIEAIESFHAEWDRGVVFVYRPESPLSSQTIYPRGLNPEHTYRVTFQESRDVYTIRGEALMTRGVQVRLPSKNFAEIVYLNGY